MRPQTIILIAACAGAIALGACSDNNNDNGGYGGGAGAGAGGSAGSSAGSGGTQTDGGEDAASGSAGSTADAAAGSGGSEDGGQEAATASSWTQVYTSVISQKCTPCHTTPNGGGILNGKLDMTSKEAAYTNLVNVPAAGTGCSGQGVRVKPGAPDESIMYLKVSLDDPAPCGAKMPFGLPALSQDEVSSIESWIKAGAPND